MTGDAINAAFEVLGAAATWANVRRLCRDRKVRGVDWRLWLFYTAWGWWNLYYYPSLGQWWSTAGGVVMILANTTWVVLAIRWRHV